MAAPDDSYRPKSTREDAAAVVRRLREAGHVAYLAGGCVRDLLLQMQPKDFDVATDAPPQRVRDLFRNTQAVGAAFGVILVRLGQSQIEVATFRVESGYADGRHPSQVQFATAQEDARRRDFTINGLFLDPINDQVIDYVGGQEDLKARQIRAIGNPAERFAEDSLRLLRAVRFSARLAFQIEPATAAAIVAHAPQLKRVSPERIAEELRIMLTPVTRRPAWRMLWDLKLVATLMRFLKATARTDDDFRPRLFDMLAPAVTIPFSLALAGAVVCYRLRADARITDPRQLFDRHEVHAAVQAMRQSLRISNEESDQMHGTLHGLWPLLADEFPRVAKLKRFLAEPTASLSRKLMNALADIGIEDRQIARLNLELDRLSKTEFSPKPFVDGDALTALGLSPGPIFKRILTDVYDAQLEGQVTAREDAIALALKIAGK